MIRVRASIISTREADALGPCLAALSAQRLDGAARDIVVVENGTQDGTAELAARFESVRVLRHAERRSFAENHNTGLRDGEWDYGLILNPDVILDPTCIASLVSFAQLHPEAGVVAPALRYPDGRPQPSARRFPRLAGTIVRRTPLRAMRFARDATASHYLPPADAARPIDWALGAALLVRRAAWNAVGGFDEGFRPLYVEDVDLAWRMWASGWTVWQEPAARAIHEHQAVTDRAFLTRRTLWHVRGMARFVVKHPEVLVGRVPRTAS